MLVSAAPTSLLFLISSILSDSRSVLPLCPLIRLSCCLKLSDRSGSNCLYSSSVLSGYNKSLDTRFFRETTQLMKLAKQRALLVSSAIRCTLFSFIFHIHSCFSRTGGVMSHLNSLTHRFVQFPPRNLCFLVTLAVCFLVFASVDAAYC